MSKSNQEKFLYLLKEVKRMDPNINLKKYNKMYSGFESACEQWESFNIKETDVGSLVFPLERLAPYYTLHKDYKALHYNLSMIAQVVVFTYRQLRMVKKKKGINLYVVSMHELAIHACIAWIMGKEKQAIWLAKEYRYHYNEGYEGKGWFDVRFAAFADFLMSWMIGGQPDTSMINPKKMGRYYQLARLINIESDPKKNIMDFLDRRIKDSYCVRSGFRLELNQTELDNADEYDGSLLKPDEDEVVDPDEPPFFYTTDVDFLSCFAFEVVVFIQLLSEHKRKDVQVSHILIDSLNEMQKYEFTLNDDLIGLLKMSDQHFSKWERGMGLSVGCSPLD